jgi:nicotinamidase-related amidase
MKILIVVDMQNDFIDGVLGTPEAVAIVPNVIEKINGFDGMVLGTLDCHEGNYLQSQEGRNLPVAHCMKGTHGCDVQADIYYAVEDALSKRSGDSAWLTKPSFGSVRLAERLVKENGEQTIDEIVLVGLCTDICVISNALIIKAFLPEVLVTVDAYCCAGVTPESHLNALAAMKMCQVNIINE